MFSFLKNKNFTRPFIAWLVVINSFFFGVVYQFNFCKTLSVRFKDFFSARAFDLSSLSHKEANNAAKNIVIVAIDADTIQYTGQKWVWKRSLTAQLLKEIASFSPKVIGLDIAFIGESSPDEDESLAEAFRKYPNFVIGYSLEERVVGKDVEESIRLPLLKFRDVVKNNIGYVSKPSSEYSELQMAKYACPFYRDKKGEYYYSLDLKVLTSYLNIPQEEIRIDDDKGIWLRSDFFIPAPKGKILINYLISPEYFVREGNVIPAHHILKRIVTKSSLEKIFSDGGNIFDWLMKNGYFKEDSGIEGHPKYLTDTLKNALEAQYPREFGQILDILQEKGRVDPQKFKDKIVVVGVTDPFVHDIFFTPVGKQFFGVITIANTIVMYMTKNFIQEVPIGKVIIFVFVIGFLILYLNVKIRPIFSSVISIAILMAAYLVALYLRLRNLEFDYLAVFSLLSTAYIFPNIYRNGYFIYRSNKLKNLAVINPSTGFYAPRYFFLRLDEIVKDKAMDIVCFAFLISNYRRLTLTLSYDKLKSLIKLLADYIESNVGKKFKNKLFSKISQDVIGIAVWGISKEEGEDFFKTFLEKLNKVDFKIEDNIIKVSSQGGIVYKPKGIKAAGGKIAYNIEMLLRELRKDDVKSFVVHELIGEVWELKSNTSSEDVMDFLTGDLEERNKEVEKALQEVIASQKETEAAYFETVCSLIKALEAKDTFTQGHSERVAKYALALAKELNLSEQEGEAIYKAALLHDIGKIGIPEYLLHKKEKLTDDEVSLIRKHEITSVEILNPVKAFKGLFPIILHHHEKYDGTGYPYGLSGDMIPRGAQILAVADVFDAITCGRGYKKGIPHSQAIEELERNSGTQFNPAYVEAFKKVIFPQRS